MAHELRVDVLAQARHRPREERMREREAAGARHALERDRAADQLGELHQLGERVALRHRVARDDQRTLGLREQARRAIDGPAVADDPRGHPRGRAEIHVAHGVEHVDRQREEHRSGRMGERGLGRAPHQPGKIVEAPDLGRPLHERARHRRQVGPQNGLGGGERLIVLSGGEQHRRAGLLEPGRHVHVDGGETAAGLRVAVGHRDGHGLLKGQHVADRGLSREAVHQRQLGRARVAEHDRHAFLLEDLEKRLLAGDVCHGADDKRRARLTPRRRPRGR